MKTESVFYTNLRQYINDNITVSELSNEPLFIKCHCTKKEKINDRAFAYHRCKQWLSDLRGAKRPPGLTIEDLEVVYNLKKEPIGSILDPDSYWNQKIVFIEDRFVDLLSIVQHDPQRNDLLKNLYLPICYDPKSSTMLVATSVEKKNHTINSQIESFETMPKPTYELRYVIISALDCTNQILNKESIHTLSGRNELFSSYSNALSCFKTACSNGRDSNNGAGLSKMVHNFARRFTDLFYVESDGGISAILNDQNIFSRYFPKSLSSKVKEKKPHIINLFNHIENLKLNNTNYERGSNYAKC